MNDHAIPDYVKNSTLRHCIDEYVRNEKHQRILKDKWFGGCSFEDLSEKYDMSPFNVKSIVYGIGDTIIVKAQKISQK